MNEKKLIENHKLIADYMGDETCISRHNEKHYWFRYYGWITPDKMQYSTSWDWIFPVYANVMYKWNFYFCGKRNATAKEATTIIRKIQNVIIVDKSISETALWCTEFIKLYNKSKK